MPRKLPPHVDRNHVKGRTYLSYRVSKGPRIRLPDDPTSEEFKAAYGAAMAGEAVPGNRANAAGQARQYRRAHRIVYARRRLFALRNTTKGGYSSRIEVLRKQHGHRSVNGLTRARIITGIMQPYADKPGAALAILKMLRILIRHAINVGWLKYDPSAGNQTPEDSTAYGPGPRTRL